MSHASHVAHIQGVSGTFVPPAHSPYEHQFLRQRIETLAGRGPALTVGIHGTRWTVARRAAAGSRFTACTRLPGRPSGSRGDATAAICIDCTMLSASDKPVERHVS